jgi:hypothetical protein
MIDEKRLHSVQYFNYYLSSMMTNDARCTSEIRPRIGMAKAALNRKKTFQQQIGLKFKEETNEVLHLEHSIV